MAARQGLAVILSLHDYEERDLSRVADVAGKIAARYAGNATLLAYDLRNEPHFSDLASAVYPGGKKAPVQENPGALKSYQELVAKAGSWVTERDYLLSSLDYLDSPEGRAVGRAAGGRGRLPGDVAPAADRRDPEGGQRDTPSPPPTATSSWPGCPRTVPWTT